MKTIFAAIAVGICTIAAWAADAQKPPPTWAWPGPTPPQIREALMKERFARRPTPQELTRIEALAPDNAPATPAQPRRVLCFGRLWTHLANPFTEETLKILGRKSGAFEVVAGDDPRLLLPENLKKFDALFLNGLHDPQPFLPLTWRQMPTNELAQAKNLDAAVKKSLLDFVSQDGKGIAAIEGALAALSDWKDYGEMMGATYNGHYRGKHVYKVEEPGHPLVACFQGKSLELDDQTYLPGAPYSREKLRVLLSLDLDRTPDPTSNEKQAWLKEHVKKQEAYTGKGCDYAVSWVRQHGRGRIFYCSLGVDWKVYLEPVFLRYILAGTQFAIGDLPAPMAPRTK